MNFQICEFNTKILQVQSTQAYHLTEKNTEGLQKQRAGSSRLTLLMAAYIWELCDLHITILIGSRENYVYRPQDQLWGEDVMGGPPGRVPGIQEEINKNPVT